MAKKYQVDIINDISAGSLDPRMIDAVVLSGCIYVLMHMQGQPVCMQNNPRYENATLEIHRFLEERIRYLGSLGIIDIIIDPGFGF